MYGSSPLLFGANEPRADLLFHSSHLFRSDAYWVERRCSCSWRQPWFHPAWVVVVAIEMRFSLLSRHHAPNMATHCWLTSYDDVDNNRRPPRQVKSNEQYGLGRAEFHKQLIFSMFSMKSIFKMLLNASNRKHCIFIIERWNVDLFNGTNRPEIHLLWRSEISSEALLSWGTFPKTFIRRQFCPSEKRLKDHCAHCSVAAISFSISLHAPSSSPLYRRGRGKQFAGSTVDRRRKSGWFPNISSLIKAAAP